MINRDLEEAMSERTHTCVDGKQSVAPTYWLYDGRGIPPCRACPQCEAEKYGRYRPDIVERAYSAADVDEPIEEDE